MVPCIGSLFAEGREWEGSVAKGGDGVVRSPRLWRQPWIEGTRNWKVSAAAYTQGIAPASAWWTSWTRRKQTGRATGAQWVRFEKSRTKCQSITLSAK